MSFVNVSRKNERRRWGHVTIGKEGDATSAGLYVAFVVKSVLVIRVL